MTLEQVGVMLLVFPHCRGALLIGASTLPACLLPCLLCRDMGTVVMGKSEAGVVKKGDSLMVMPNK